MNKIRRNPQEHKRANHFTMEGYLYVQEKSKIYFCIPIVHIMRMQARLISTDSMKTTYSLLNSHLNKRSESVMAVLL